MGGGGGGGGCTEFEGKRMNTKISEGWRGRRSKILVDMGK